MAVALLSGLCLALSVTFCAVHGDELVMSSTTFRHGDRSAIDTFPNNTCDESCWPQGYGQLSQIGMRQHYMLGQYLHSRYRAGNSLLNGSYYLKSQVHVRSTDVDRTLMSAESQLSSLYPPTGFQVFEPSLPWMPIPVHTVPKANDSMLRAYDTSANACPKYTDLYHSKSSLPRYQEVQNANQEFIDWVAQMAGIEYELNLGNIFLIEDPLFCQDAHGLKLPSWVNASTLDRMHRLGGISMGLMFETTEMRRLAAGVLVGKILSDMKNRSTDEPTPTEKLFLYSAHDTTVTALLQALDIFNGVQPPYASAVIIELYKPLDGSEHYVKVLFRNETDSNSSVPVDLTPTLPQCLGHDKCPLSNFTRYYSNIVVSNWYEACHDGSSSPLEFNTVTIATVSIAAIFFVALLILFAMFVHNRRQKGGYSSLSAGNAGV